MIEWICYLLEKEKKDIVSEFGISRSTLSTILKDKEKLCASSAVGNSKKKRQRESTLPKADDALFQWFTAARAQSVLVSGEILKAKAEELSEEFNHSDSWTCSSRWLCQWKKHHNIAYRSISSENAAVDKELYDDWKRQTLQPILSRYDPNDIFNADEMGLYWTGIKF